MGHRWLLHRINNRSNYIFLEIMIYSTRSKFAVLVKVENEIKIIFYVSSYLHSYYAGTKGHQYVSQFFFTIIVYFLCSFVSISCTLFSRAREKTFKVASSVRLIFTNTRNKIRMQNEIQIFIADLLFHGERYNVQ